MCDGIVINPSTHRDNTQDSTAKDPRGRRLQRAAGYIRGFLPANTEVSGAPGSWRPSEVKKIRKAQRTLYVSTLEGECGYCTGGNRTATKMKSTGDTHAGGAADETHTDG